MKRSSLLVAALFALSAVPALAQSPAPFNPDALRLDRGTKSATATAGAATLSKNAGVVTSEALTTAAGATYTLALTNARVALGDEVFVSVANGTNSAGTPTVTRVQPGAGTLTVVVQNIHASAAFNGTLLLSFAVIKN